MKEFSNYEKRILLELTKVDETPGGLTVLGNIIDFELYPNFYIELKSEDNCPVRIAKSYLDEITANYGTSALNEAIKQLNNKLLFIVKLFQYLEREGQIYLSGDFPSSTLGSTFDVRETPVGYELEDKETVNWIYKLSRKKIVPEDSLKRFIKNGFQTDLEIKNEQDRKRAERKIDLTNFGIIATLIVGILASIPNFVQMFKGKETNKIIIVDTVNVKASRDTLNIKVSKYRDTLAVKQIQTIKTVKGKYQPSTLKVEIVKFDDSLKIKK
jgi:hypothetical protein